eukprot:COSAG01_NODE_5204_length_4413_cov_2.276541_2_plen_337_part_00
MKNNTTLLFTIDAEGVHGNRPFNQFMLGEVGESEPWGIELQAKIFKSYGIQATFFLDVYEHSFYGNDAMQGVVDTLLKYDQDIQLHTHPGWFEDARDFKHVTKMRREKSCFDYKRPWMWCYSLEEQVEILQHGIDCLKRWGVGMPVAHRAGAYGLNKDTIMALKKVGIPIDSSMFYGHKNCKEVWSHNQVIKKMGILEIPVTGYCLDEYLTCNFLKYKFHDNRFIKTDIDGSSLKELSWFLDQAVNNNLSVINFFMHSYSLLKFHKKFKWIKSDLRKRNTLETFIEYALNKNDVEVASIKEYWHKIKFKDVEFNEYIPVYNKSTPLIRKVINKVCS